MVTVNEAPIESLTITASGPATDQGRISLSELARIAAGFQATLERIAYSLVVGRRRQGRRPREIADAVRMDFVGFDRGSAVLNLQRSPNEALDDLLSDSFRALTSGLESLKRAPRSMPEHFDPVIVNGLVALCGGISRRNVHEISFSEGGRTYFTLDAEMRQSLRQVQKSGSQQELTIVGRLHMGDFDPLGLRCRPMGPRSAYCICRRSRKLRRQLRAHWTSSPRSRASPRWMTSQHFAESPSTTSTRSLP